MFATSLAPWFTRHNIHYGWAMVALTFLTAVCAAAALSMPGVLLLPISQEFGWTRGDVSGAIALMLVMFGAMAPFSGPLLQRFGLRRVVTVALLSAATALIGTTQVTEKWHLWLSIGIVLGLAAGASGMALSATVANRWFSQRRGLVMGILTAGMATGQLSFLPTAAWLASHYGWRVAVIPAVIGCCICAVLYPLFGRDWPSDIGLPPYGETTSRPPSGTTGNVVAVSFAVLREGMGAGWFWLLAGTFFICGASSTGIVQQHFIPFCADNNVTPVRAASFLAVLGVFNFTGTIASGLLSDRFDNRLLLVWYYALRGLQLFGCSGFRSAISISFRYRFSPCSSVWISSPPFRPPSASPPEPLAPTRLQSSSVGPSRAISLAPASLRLAPA